MITSLLAVATKDRAATISACRGCGLSLAEASTLVFGGGGEQVTHRLEQRLPSGGAALVGAQRRRPEERKERVGKARSSKAEARKRMEHFRMGFVRQVPEAMECLVNGFEHLHGAVKRRINAVGAFPDRQSALRLITAVALNTTALWAARRYLDMSVLQQKEGSVTKAA